MYKQKQLPKILWQIAVFSVLIYNIKLITISLLGTSSGRCMTRKCGTTTTTHSQVKEHNEKACTHIPQEFFLPVLAQRTFRTCDNIKRINLPDGPREDYMPEVIPVDKTRELKIYIYNAFYDDRPTIENNTRYVRVFTMANSDLVGRVNRIFAYLWYQGRTHPYSIHCHANNPWRNWGWHQKITFSCELPKWMPGSPTHVSLSENPCSPPTNMVKVVTQSFHGREDEDSIKICIKDIYGNPNPLRLVEWIELNLMAGIKKFTFYNTSIQGAANDVLEYYKKKGVAEVLPNNFVPWFSKLVDNQTYPVDYRWEISTLTTMSLSDCLYRSQSKYILFLDFDEVIYPLKHGSFQKFLAAMEEKTLYANFYFHTTFFTDKLTEEWPKKVTQPWFLHTMTHNVRTAPFLQTPKSIMLRDGCADLNHHMCTYLASPRIELTKYVPVEFGFVRHYRFQCNQVLETHDKLCSTGVQWDDSLHKVKSTLIKRVKPVLIRLGLFQKYNSTKTNPTYMD